MGNIQGSYDTYMSSVEAVAFQLVCWTMISLQKRMGNLEGNGARVQLSRVLCDCCLII